MLPPLCSFDHGYLFCKYDFWFKYVTLFLGRLVGCQFCILLHNLDNGFRDINITSHKYLIGNVSYNLTNQGYV